MKIKELIALLNQYDQDMLVIMHDVSMHCGPVKGIADILYDDYNDMSYPLDIENKKKNYKRAISLF